MLIAELATSEFCTSTANIWQLVGYVLLVFKIIIPLLLIIFGMFDLGKAVINSEEKKIKEATSSFIKRVIIAVVIFLIPTLVGFVFDIIGGFTEQMKNDYGVCKSCLISPTGSKCKTPAANAWNGTTPEA